MSNKVREAHIQCAAETLMSLETVIAQFQAEHDRQIATGGLGVLPEELTQFHTSIGLTLRRIEAHLKIAELLPMVRAVRSPRRLWEQPE